MLNAIKKTPHILKNNEINNCNNDQYAKNVLMIIIRTTRAEKMFKHFTK